MELVVTSYVSPASVGELTDGEWLDKLDASLERDVIEGVRYPHFPDDQTQMNFVGSTRRHALLEAVRFVRYATDALAWTGGPPPGECSVVDFGCGWGRITRTLLRSFDPARSVSGLMPRRVCSASSTTAPPGDSYRGVESRPGAAS